ncbi:MAG: hypothetical protein ACTSVV_03905 [Promethearchaeota archaeon]
MKYKIELGELEITGSTIYYHLNLVFEGKNVTLCRTLSYDKNLGVTDDSIEVVEGDLTEEEEEFIKDYCKKI